jgi:hypothetical protein
MKELIEIVNHRGARIIDSDYSGLTGEPLNACIHEHNEEIWKLINLGEKNIRFLTDVTNTIGDRDTVKIFKETSKKHEPYTKKSAVVGVVGVQKVLLHAVNVFSDLKTLPFNTREEALDYLAQD